MYEPWLSWFFEDVSGHIPSAAGTPRCFELRADSELIIGRNPQISNVPVNNAHVSRRHALLRSTKEGCFIEDLNTFNGTRVNGVRIEESIQLHDGDQVSLGEDVILFVHRKYPGKPKSPPVSNDPSVRVLTAEMLVKLNVINFENAGSEFDLLLATRNVRFQAWKAQCLSFDAGWSYFLTGPMKMASLWVRCRECKRSIEEHVDFYFGAYTDLLISAETKTVEQLMREGCRHLGLLLDEDPPEIKAYIEQKRLASRKKLD